MNGEMFFKKKSERICVQDERRKRKGGKLDRVE